MATNKFATMTTAAVVGMLSFVGIDKGHVIPVCEGKVVCRAPSTDEAIAKGYDNSKNAGKPYWVTGEHSANKIANALRSGSACLGPKAPKKPDLGYCDKVLLTEKQLTEAKALRTERKEERATARKAEKAVKKAPKAGTVAEPAAVPAPLLSRAALIRAQMEAMALRRHAATLKESAKADEKADGEAVFAECEKTLKAIAAQLAVAI